MVPLLPKYLLSIRKTEAAAIVVLGAIHAGLLILVVFWGEESSEHFATLANSFLFCQFGLLAEWIGVVLLHWVILGGSFFLLRMAGFRITRARSRVLRRWGPSELHAGRSTPG